MRLLVLGAVAALGVLFAGAAPAEARPRALIAYLPTEPAPRMPLLFDLAERGMSYGFVSPTLGGYSKRQMALDVSQGSRVSTRAYDQGIPQLVLREGRLGWRIAHWTEAAQRADDTPGEAVPGLLAEAVRDAGGRVAYAGVLGFEQLEAISAADRGGRIEAVELSTLGMFAERAVALWERSDLLIARLPEEEAGLEALDRLLAARDADDLVIALRAPPGGRLRLLPAGVAGPGFDGGRLTSDTTRLDGFVSAIDIAPAVLRHLGVEASSAMSGRTLRPTPGGSAEGLRAQAARFDVVVSRRGPALRWSLAGFAALLAGLLIARGRRGVRDWLRLGLLGALWMPGVALATAALRPSRAGEVAVLVLGSLVLAAVTDRLLPWPRGPALPAAVVFVAHAIDLALGSPLIDASLAGPNPQGGARFFGIGNELETILSVTVLVGTGALLAWRCDARAPRAFAAAAIVAGVVIGAGRLGADVGGVVTLGAGGAAAVLAALAARRGFRLRGRTLALALAAPPLAVAALIAIDLVSGGGAHLSRFVIDADSPGELVDIVERRFEISFGGLASGGVPASLALAVLLLVAGAVRHRAVLAPLRDQPGLRAGLIGAFAAVVAGALANDSGPLILLIGTVLLLLSAGYAHGRPARPAGP